MDSTTRPRWPTSLCLAGVASLVGAVVVAVQHPATEYELSIYAATPVWFWVGVFVAFFLGALVAFTAGSRIDRRLGIALGGLASFAVASLPLLRGYFFHGIHDSVTHVGLTRELVAGTVTPLRVLYPGIHTTAAFIGGVTGLSLWRSTMLVALAVVVVFFVFVPLVVRAMVGSETALTVGAFSAFLLVPLHQLAATLHPHPSSQTILFAPVVVFLLIGFLRSTDPERLRGYLDPVSVALLLTIGASILYHPQQALNVLLLLGVVALVQVVARLRTDGALWPNHRPLYAVVAVSTVAYLAWVSKSQAVVATLGGAADSLTAYLGGPSVAAGAAIGSQAASLRAIGSGLLEIYLKLFLVSTLYILAAGVGVVVAIAAVSVTEQDVADTRRLVLYLLGGVAAMIVVFGVYLFGNVGQYYFRQASFVMLIVTVVGALGIAYGSEFVTRTRLRGALRPALVTGFTVLFLLSVLVLFNSPYIHRANQHVTEARVSGYETTFEVTGDSAVLAGVRQEPQRYYEGIVGLENNGRRDGLVNSSEIRQLQERPQDDWYLVVTRNTYEREIEAYREYRYSRADLESVHRQVGVNRVFANGDAELYYVP